MSRIKLHFNDKHAETENKKNVLNISGIGSKKRRDVSGGRRSKGAKDQVEEGTGNFLH